jgi:hypothetical protein
LKENLPCIISPLYSFARKSIVDANRTCKKELISLSFTVF